MRRLRVAPRHSGGHALRPRGRGPAGVGRAGQGAKRIRAREQRWRSGNRRFEPGGRRCGRRCCGTPDAGGLQQDSTPGPSHGGRLRPRGRGLRRRRRRVRVSSIRRGAGAVRHRGRVQIGTAWLRFGRAASIAGPRRAGVGGRAEGLAQAAQPALHAFEQGFQGGGSMRRIGHVQCAGRRRAGPTEIPPRKRSDRTGARSSGHPVRATADKDLHAPMGQVVHSAIGRLRQG